MPVRHDLICPDCGASMVLRSSSFGRFYGCSTFPKCKSAHGAHDDGTPLGIPASKPVKDARIRAHTEFDKLWKPPNGVMSRTDSYAWMARALGMSSADAHIGRLDIAQCERLIEAVRARLADPNPAPETLRASLFEFCGDPDVFRSGDPHVDGMQDYAPEEDEGEY